MGRQRDMTIDQAGTIDIVDTDTDGSVCMSIVDHWRWDDPRAHLSALEAKRNSYIEFIESGQLASEYPNARTASALSIALYVSYEPPQSLFDYLADVRPILAEVGVTISVLPSPTLEKQRRRRAKRSTK